MGEKSVQAVMSDEVILSIEDIQAAATNKLPKHIRGQYQELLP
jgi:hypothetical protein